MEKYWRKPNLNASRVIRTKRKKIIEEPDFDILKNFRLVRFWVRDNYNITLPELEMLLYLYGEGLFDYGRFLKYQDLNGWDSKKFKRMKDTGWIVPFGRGMNSQIVYELSQKGRLVCSRVYKMLNGLELIPEDPKKNKSIGQDRWSARQRWAATHSANMDNYKHRITFRDPDADMD